MKAAVKKEVIRQLRDAKRIADLPSCADQFTACERDSAGNAVAATKVGYIEAAIDRVLLTLGATP